MGGRKVNVFDSFEDLRNKLRPDIMFEVFSAYQPKLRVEYHTYEPGEDGELKLYGLTIVNYTSLEGFRSGVFNGLQ